MTTIFKSIDDLMNYQEEVVSKCLTKLVELETPRSKRALINAKIKLDAYSKAKELMTKTK